MPYVFIAEDGILNFSGPFYALVHLLLVWIVRDKSIDI